ncbi:MAG: hypothetical protein AAF380_03260, partial [Bacteroidota bacterium]
NYSIYPLFLLLIIGFPQLNASQEAFQIEEKEGKMQETQQYNTPGAPKGLVYNHTLHVGKYVNNEVENLEDIRDIQEILDSDIFTLKKTLENKKEEIILAAALQSKQERKYYKYLFSNKGLLQGEASIVTAHKRRLGYQIIKTTSPHIIVGLLEWLSWSQQQSVGNNEFFKTYTPTALSTNWPICKACHLIALHMFKIDLLSNEKGCLSQPLQNKIDCLPHLAQQYINTHLTLPLVEHLVVPMLGYVKKQKEEKLKEAINKLLLLFIKKEKEASSYNGMNSLHIIVIKGEAKKLEILFKEIPELTEELAKQGVKNKADWRYGFNAMHLAARYNQTEIVNVFFKKNAKLVKTLATQGVQDNKEEYNGFNALYIAAYWRCTKVGQLLFEQLPELAEELAKKEVKNRKLTNGFNGINISAYHNFDDSEEKKMDVSDIIAPQQVLICQGHENCVESVSWSHDDRFLASASWDKTVRIWDRHSGKQGLICQGHTDFVKSVSWSHDDRFLASASADNTVCVWDRHSAKQVRICKGHTNCVRSVSWSHDDRFLASASGGLAIFWSDNTVRVWDRHSAKQVLICKGHSSFVRSVSWSHDDRFLASASSDNTVRVWDM